MSWPETQTRRILIAEDDRDVLDLIRVRLGVAGYQVAYERDGLAALKSIGLTHPDAVILDVNMPELDGFEVLRALKLAPATATIPVMMLTARNAPEDVQKAIRLGAKDFLAKPFDDVNLLRRVARLFARRAPPRGGSDAVWSIG